MKIRNVTKRDQKKITELYHQLYPERKQKRTIPIKKFNAKSFILVAEEKKKIVGFTWVTFISYGISRFGYIEELFVKKDFRNRGIGTSLVKKTMKKMKKLKVDALFVTTGRKNKNAIKLYKDLGFKITKGYWFHWTYKRKYLRRRKR